MKTNPTLAIERVVRLLAVLILAAIEKSSQENGGPA